MLLNKTETFSVPSIKTGGFFYEGKNVCLNKKIIDMAEDYQKCPNCDTPIKSSMFNVNLIVDNEKSRNLIHEFSDNKSPAYCNKCFDPINNNARNSWAKEFENAKADYKKWMSLIPIITLQNPKDWDYIVIGIVTAQCVTGTGVISEISSSFSDFFGLQSSRLDNKLRNGENICRQNLQLEAVKKGGNAIIATDVDYAEVGGDKGMLMVCMSGTAIKLNNTDVLFANVDYHKNLIEAYKKVEHLSTYE